MTDTPPNEHLEELANVSDPGMSDEAARAEAVQAKALIDAYGVNLDVFEGPLDLLLYLIRKSEVDIYDIPVAHITAQYLAFLRGVHLLDLESAADFILMAATLMKIKSQMLLPRDIEGEDLDEGMGDPREELVRKLLEYQQFKEIADWLSDQGTEQRDIYQRPGGLPEDAEDAELQPVSLFDLLKVYKHVIDHVPQAAVHRIIEEEVAIDECIDRILGELHQRSRLRFHDLISGQSRLTLVATFIGILELLKSQRIRVHQAGPFEDIWIEGRESEESDSWDSGDDVKAEDETEDRDAVDHNVVEDEPSLDSATDGLPSIQPSDEQPVQPAHQLHSGDEPSDANETNTSQDPADSFHHPPSESSADHSSSTRPRGPGSETNSDALDNDPPTPTALATQEPDDLEADASRVVDAAERLGDVALPSIPLTDSSATDDSIIAGAVTDASTDEPPSTRDLKMGTAETWEDSLGEDSDGDRQVTPVDMPPPPTPGPQGLSDPEERS